MPIGIQDILVQLEDFKEATTLLYFEVDVKILQQIVDID